MAQIWLVCFLAAAAMAVSNDDIVDRLDGLEQMMQQVISLLRTTVESNSETLKEVMTLLNGTNREELRNNSSSPMGAAYDVNLQLASLSDILCGGIGITPNNTRLGNLRCVQQNGKPVLQGRVEVFFNGSWGTVCDDNFHSNAATVVCRSLGFSHGTAMDRAYFGQGSGSIWLDQVECSGSEDNIFSCPANDIGDHDCEHKEDVGVKCW